MSIPLPAVGEAKVDPPDFAETSVVVGAVAAAVTAADGLTSLQLVMIEAIAKSMTGFEVPLSALSHVAPDELAETLRLRDEAFRSHVLRYMLLAALVLDPLPSEVVDRVDAYARALGVQNDMLLIAHEFAHGSYELALMDFDRSGYLETWDPGRSAVLHTSQALETAWQSVVDDEMLAKRWESLRELSDGTLGREVAKFYDARGFAFPGRPGSAPPLLAQHDWVHVLAGYGSTVESEIEVFGFIAVANDDPRAFSLLAQVVSLFETGHAASGLGLFRADRGNLSHQGVATRLADALRRGAQSAAANNGIDFLAVDWFDYAEHQVDDVRVTLGVVPKDRRAVEAGSPTPWEPGGMSPYQYRAGQRAAEEQGRPYDSYGASPAARSPRP